MTSFAEGVGGRVDRPPSLLRFLPRVESGVAAALTLLLIFLIMAPLASVALTAASDNGGISFKSILTVLSSTRIIGNTLAVSVGSTAIAVGVGGLLAFILVRTDVPGRRLLERLVILPLYITPLLTAIGWSWLGSPRGGLVNLIARQFFGIPSLINLHSAGGVIFVTAMSSVPLPFLLISGALRSMDPSLEESARIQGASLTTAFRRITFPLVLPAIISSALLVFVHGIGLFSVPAILGLPVDFYVVGTEIYTSLTTFPPRIGQAAAWGLILLIVTALLVWLQARTLGNRSFVTITGKAFRPRIVELGRLRILWAVAAWAYLAAAVFLPVLALLWASLINFITLDFKLMTFDFSHFQYILVSYPKTYIATWNSFLLSVLAATIICGLGLAIGWILIRSRTRLKPVMELLSMAPLAIPPPTFALGLLWFYVGLKWLPVYGTLWILLIAYVAHFLPYGVRAASNALRQVHPELEEAARVSGGSWRQAMRFVALPLTRPSLTAAWTLVFVMAMQEVTASILLYTNKSVVLSVTMFALWEQGNLSGLAALSILQLAFMFAVIALFVRPRQTEIV